MAAQAKQPSMWVGKAPRPELMPGGMGRPAAQAKAAPGAPPLPRLPGMGRPTMGMPRSVAQRRTDGGVVTSPMPDGRLRLLGPGKPLDGGIRDRMEKFFGADFSTVRVYEGPAAEAMGAFAFTLGETLYFAPGQYDPKTRAGAELLGHELTHVLQQRAGLVQNPYGQGIAIVQDPALEADADAMGRDAAQAISGEGTAGRRAPSGPRPAPGDTLQGYWLLIGGLLIGGYYFGRWMGWWGKSGKATPADPAYLRGANSWKDGKKSIDESFTITQHGTLDEMHEVSMRNNLTLRARLDGTKVNGRDLLEAVDTAASQTQGVLCTNFARTLRGVLFKGDSWIPNKVKDEIKAKDFDDMIKTITDNSYAPGTAILYGNEGNMHMTTIVATVDGQVILVEQHPSSPRVLFKTLTRALDEWRLALAINPDRAEVAEIIVARIGIYPPPKN